MPSPPADFTGQDIPTLNRETLLYRYRILGWGEKKRLQNFDGELLRKHPLETPRKVWEYHIKVDLRMKIGKMGANVVPSGELLYQRR